jgi:magnesium transporter
MAMKEAERCARSDDRAKVACTQATVMAKRRKKKSRPAPGTAPGTLVADPNAPKPVIHAMVFDTNTVEAIACAKAEDLRALYSRGKKIWVDVEGLGEVATVQTIGEIFNLHPLSLEDVMNVHQRAKTEHYGDTTFVVLRMACGNENLETEQVSIFLGERFVITFQEGIEGDSFGVVRERLKKAGGPIRTAPCDYLAYSLIDAVVDHYFPVIERFGERLDELEDSVILQPSQQTLNEVHLIKRDLLTLRKAFWPLRDAVNILVRDPIPHIHEETRVYLRDVHDHIIQVIDIVETYRELASGLMDVYLSSVSNRMNEVMKLLTLIATIFIPLTFIAGVYGMNFDSDVSPWNMPELKWYFGYPFSLGLMLLTMVVLLLYFRSKGWFSTVLVLPSTKSMRKKAAAAEAADRARGVHPM